MTVRSILSYWMMMMIMMLVMMGLRVLHISDEEAQLEILGLVLVALRGDVPRRILSGDLRYSCIEFADPEVPFLSTILLIAFWTVV